MVKFLQKDNCMHPPNPALLKPTEKNLQPLNGFDICSLELGKILRLVSDSHLEESLKERDYG